MRCTSELPKQGTETQLLPRYDHPVLCEMLAGLSCCPTAATPVVHSSKQVSYHVTQHHKDVSRHPIPLKKAVVVFICTSSASKQPHQCSPDPANQTKVLGFRGNWIPLQPYWLCRPNLLRLWYTLTCPQRHLRASPRSNKEVSCLQEWCHQLKLTFFYHPKTSRVLIKNGCSIKILVAHSRILLGTTKPKSPLHYS